jgi:hypothetical protein
MLIRALSHLLTQVPGRGPLRGGFADRDLFGASAEVLEAAAGDLREALHCGTLALGRAHQLYRSLPMSALSLSVCLSRSLFSFSLRINLAILVEDLNIFLAIYNHRWFPPE